MRNGTKEHTRKDENSDAKPFADNNNDLFAAAPKPFFADKQGDKKLLSIFNVAVHLIMT